MNIILHKTRFKTNLIYLLFVKLVLINGGKAMDCRAFQICDILPGVLEDCNFETPCPFRYPQIRLVRYSNHRRSAITGTLDRLEIDCSGTSDSDHKVYDLIPASPYSKVYSVDSFKWCPMPVETTMKDILDKFKIYQIEELTFNLSLIGPVSHLPENLFDDIGIHITSLEMRSTNVHLPHNLFVNLRELEYLELSSNNFSKLERGVFRNNNKLKRLNLSGNNLRNLAKDSFDGVPSVTDLDLSSNLLIELPEENYFFIYTMKLLVLRLSNNLLREISA